MTTGEVQPAEARQASRRPRRLCASYAAGAVCCCAAGAHLVASESGRGLFSVAPHASDILTWAGGYKALHVTIKRAGAPVMTALSASLQRRLAAVEVEVAKAARDAAGRHSPRPPAGTPGRPATTC